VGESEDAQCPFFKVIGVESRSEIVQRGVKRRPQGFALLHQTLQLLFRASGCRAD
jgi:hypothetical protein